MSTTEEERNDDVVHKNGIPYKLVHGSFDLLPQLPDEQVATCSPPTRVK